jgi:hypothetical protein
LNVLESVSGNSIHYGHPYSYEVEVVKFRRDTLGPRQIQPIFQHAPAIMIPFIYRLAFNWIEPLFAFSGALQSYLAPAQLLGITHPGIRYSQSLHPVFTQLSGGWVYLAFNDVVTLRATDDTRVWTAILAGSLLSDVLYLASILEHLGPSVFFNPARWTKNQWSTMVLTLPFTALKLAFIARTGLL